MTRLTYFRGFAATVSGRFPPVSICGAREGVTFAALSQVCENRLGINKCERTASGQAVEILHCQRKMGGGEEGVFTQSHEGAKVSVRHCERSEAIQCGANLDCFVAALLTMMGM